MDDGSGVSIFTDHHTSSPRGPSVHFVRPLEDPPPETWEDGMTEDDWDQSRYVRWVRQIQVRLLGNARTPAGIRRPILLDADLKSDKILLHPEYLGTEYSGTVVHGSVTIARTG